MEHAACYEIVVEVDDTVAIQPSPLYKKEIQNIEEQVWRRSTCDIIAWDAEIFF